MQQICKQTYYFKCYFMCILETALDSGIKWAHYFAFECIVTLNDCKRFETKRCSIITNSSELFRSRNMKWISALATVLVLTTAMVFGKIPIAKTKCAYGFHFLYKLLSFNSAKPIGRIVGGIPISIETVPYQVSLQMVQFGWITGHFCAASIISEHFLLTASHCVK